MSNHTGSYMLNDVLLLLDKYKFNRLLGREQTQRFVLDILELSKNYDCNVSEILCNGVGPRVGLCYYCLQPATEFSAEACLKCSALWK
jgi:hypothetical protein